MSSAMGEATEPREVAKGSFPPTARERGKVAPARLAHLVLKTGRFEAMKRWYATVLEAVPVFEADNLVFLTYDDEHHRIAIVGLPALATAPKFVTGLDHVAFTYADIGDLVDTYKRLKGERITPHWCINHGPTTSLYYHDPDGNGVELQIDNYKTLDELAGTFQTDEFEDNPIGEDFDPEELVRRYESGEPFEELRKFQTRTKRGPADVPPVHLGRVHALLARVGRLLGKV